MKPEVTWIPTDEEREVIEAVFAPARKLAWVVVDHDGYPLARFEYREHATDWMDAMKHHEKHWRLERRQ